MTASTSTAHQNPALGWAKIIGKIFYLLVAAVVVFMVFKFAPWNWGVISIFIVTLGFILIFLRSDIFRSGLFIFITLYLATDFTVWIFRQLTTNASVMAFIRDSAVLSFLLDGTGGRLFWSIMAGFILALVVTLTPLLILAFVSSVFILALHKMDGVSLWDAVVYTVSLILGINQAYIVVENGQAVITKEAGRLGVLGGPGHLVVKQGNVVVLERGGKITRIVNAGVIKLKRLETIRNIFILGLQSKSAEFEHVLTRDRIPLTISMGIKFLIEPASEVEKRTESHITPHGEALTAKLDDGLYQVYEGTIRKAALMAQRLTFDQLHFSKCEDQICRDIEVTKWQDVAGSVPEGELRDYIISHDFDELFELAGITDGTPQLRVSSRKILEIEQAILNQIRPTRLTFLGVLVRSVDIGKIEFSWWAEGLMLGNWGQKIKLDGGIRLADFLAQARVIDARAKAQARILEGQGEGEARAAFVREALEEIRRYVPIEDEEVARFVLPDLIKAMRYIDDWGFDSKRKNRKQKRSRRRRKDDDWREEEWRQEPKPLPPPPTEVNNSRKTVEKSENK